MSKSGGEVEHSRAQLFFIASCELDQCVVEAVCVSLQKPLRGSLKKRLASPLPDLLQLPGITHSAARGPPAERLVRRNRGDD